MDHVIRYGESVMNPFEELVLKWLTALEGGVMPSAIDYEIRLEVLRFSSAAEYRRRCDYYEVGRSSDHQCHFRFLFFLFSISYSTNTSTAYSNPNLAKRTLTDKSIQ